MVKMDYTCLTSLFSFFFLQEERNRGGPFHATNNSTPETWLKTLFLPPCKTSSRYFWGALSCGVCFFVVVGLAYWANNASKHSLLFAVSNNLFVKRFTFTYSLWIISHFVSRLVSSVKKPKYLHAFWIWAGHGMAFGPVIGAKLQSELDGSPISNNSNTSWIKIVYNWLRSGLTFKDVEWA